MISGGSNEQQAQKESQKTINQDTLLFHLVDRSKMVFVNDITDNEEEAEEEQSE